MTQTTDNTTTTTNEPKRIKLGYTEPTFRTSTEFPIIKGTYSFEKWTSKTNEPENGKFIPKQNRISSHFGRNLTSIILGKYTFHLQENFTLLFNHLNKGIKNPTDRLHFTIERGNLNFWNNFIQKKLTLSIDSNLTQKRFESTIETYLTQTI